MQELTESKAAGGWKKQMTTEHKPTNRQANGARRVASNLNTSIRASNKLPIKCLSGYDTVELNPET